MVAITFAWPDGFPPTPPSFARVALTVARSKRRPGRRGRAVGGKGAAALRPGAAHTEGTAGRGCGTIGPRRPGAAGFAAYGLGHSAGTVDPGRDGGRPGGIGPVGARGAGEADANHESALPYTRHPGADPVLAGDGTGTGRAYGEAAAADCWCAGLAKSDSLSTHVRASCERYAAKLGENAYAVFNAITDFSSHPPANRSVCRERHSLQRLAGSWRSDFSREI